MDIINDSADGRNIYKTLTGASDMVPLTEYQALQNSTAEKISDLHTELRQKGEYIANLERQVNSAHICPVCGRQFFETPAISRRDESMKICSVCAATEALEDAREAGAISRGEAKEIQEIIEDVAKEEEKVIPRQSTPEQCSKGGRKTQMGKKVDLPMDEIMELKAKGWSNVRIAGRYGVADVTIGTRIKQYLAKDKPAEKPAEPAKVDTRRPFDIADLRARREAGETYEHIGKEYGGWTEDEVHAFMIQKGKEERNG
jgi:ribosomal protein L37AE/L43A